MHFAPLAIFVFLALAAAFAYPLSERAANAFGAAALLALVAGGLFEGAAVAGMIAGH